MQIQTLVHSLRSPLAAITAAVELLQIPGLPPEQRDHVIGIISRQAETMAVLLNAASAEANRSNGA